MFAIEITLENVLKISESHNAPDPDEFAYAVFVAHERPFYYVSGYVTQRGEVLDFGILPEHKLIKQFEYDPIKIQTDWDQIVRKPEGP